jgi:hypothetical protein
VPLIRIYTDERGEPRARIVEEDGNYVVSMDVFRDVPAPPPDAEVLQIGERYKIYVRKCPLLRGVCEFVYFQFPGGVQLINAKYVGPDDPEVVIQELSKAYQEEVPQDEKHGAEQ